MSGETGEPDKRAAVVGTGPVRQRQPGLHERGAEMLLAGALVLVAGVGVQATQPQLGRPDAGLVRTPPAEHHDPGAVEGYVLAGGEGPAEHRGDPVEAAPLHDGADVL